MLGLTGYYRIVGVCWHWRGMLGLTGYVRIDGACWDCRVMLGLTGYVGIDNMQRDMRNTARTYTVSRYAKNNKRKGIIVLSRPIHTS
jgi:hypothetical protein